MIDFKLFFDNFDIHHIVVIAEEKNVVTVVEINKHDSEKENCEIDRK